ncbi:hypothetical protein U9M48_004997 [Paspalum notatum var. saurae]|uniref:Uncharacterized protein n=1 Tax=Paspalum notatum var. saurae TaxID=547442 RepID=A0AAQ3PLE6_PASNO
MPTHLISNFSDGYDHMSQIQRIHGSPSSTTLNGHSLPPAAANEGPAAAPPRGLPVGGPSAAFPSVAPQSFGGSSTWSPHRRLYEAPAAPLCGLPVDGSAKLRRPLHSLPVGGSAKLRRPPLRCLLVGNSAQIRRPLCAASPSASRQSSGSAWLRASI